MTSTARWLVNLCLLYNALLCAASSLVLLITISIHLLSINVLIDLQSPIFFQSIYITLVLVSAWFNALPFLAAILDLVHDVYAAVFLEDVSLPRLVESTKAASINDSDPSLVVAPIFPLLVLLDFSNTESPPSELSRTHLHLRVAVGIAAVAVAVVVVYRSRGALEAALTHSLQWVVPSMAILTALVLAMGIKAASENLYAAFAQMHMCCLVLPACVSFAYMCSRWIRAASLCLRHVLQELDRANIWTLCLGAAAIPCSASARRLLPDVFKSGFADMSVLLACTRIFIRWHVKTQRRSGGAWQPSLPCHPWRIVGLPLVVFLAYLAEHLIQPGIGISGSVSADAVSIDQMVMSTSLHLVGKGTAARPRGDERRTAADGKNYTFEEFLEYYGGSEEWHEAERRIAPHGLAYTRAEFQRHYGGTKEWRSAQHRSEACVGCLNRSSYKLCHATWGGLRLVDFAILVQLSYFDWDNHLSFLNASLEKLFGTATGVPEIIPDVGLACSGTTCSRKAQLYQFDFPELKLSVFAIRGTDPFHFADIIEDARLWVEPVLLDFLSNAFPTIRLWPPGSTALFIRGLHRMKDLFQTKVSLDYIGPLEDAIRGQQAKYVNRSDWQFFLTGHSLGGGLAGIIGGRLKLEAVAFSPPGLMLSRKKFDLALRDLAQYSVAVLPTRDPVPLVDVQFGLVQHTICNRTVPILCHLPGSMICDLLARCGDSGEKRFSSCSNDDSMSNTAGLWAKMLGR